jgi:protein-S-isoprenylcysteine O-methyltransferase Ste14
VEEKKQGVWAPLLGTAIFFCLAPGVVAGILPGAIAGWQIGLPFLGLKCFRVLGVMLIIMGAACLMESFARFAIKGRGTPAIVAPPVILVVSGLYRYVRNPMYLAVVATILGQALLFGSILVLGYAGFIWCLFFLFVIAEEEPTLRLQFGESYVAYQAGVRRWWPRVKPWSSAAVEGRG